jgi:signal transduction histidine kinase/ActR/RegA family two-component response regulator
VKLRSHLVLLVLGAVLPVLAFSAVMGVVFWRQQRAVVNERLLERVRALAIALDREMAGHVRAIEVLARSRALQANDFRVFHDQAQRVRAEQPAWDALIVLAPDGTQLMNTRVPFGSPLPKSAIDPALLARVASSRRPAVTPLVIGAIARKPTTSIIVPVASDGSVPSLLAVAIEPRVWLEIFAPYPLPDGATITVLDQHGIITARTLNPERSIGRPPSPALAQRAREMAEGTFRNPGGLEGQLFYSAFSRSALAGWTVATGVPAATVEQELRASVAAMTAGAAVMALLAVGLALLFGRRIAGPVVALARSVRGFGAGEPPAVLPAPAVDEVREVARAFEEAAAQLGAREAALRESRAQAETANRMKDEFLAVLSHELRTPINAVYGWARMLRDGAVQGPAAAKGLEIIERNASAQVRLIEDLLDISRIVSGKMRLDVRLVDVRTAIGGALDSVRHAAEARGIQLERVLDRRLGPVAGDADRLQQVVWNLLSNAIKFTPRGGRVEVRASQVGTRIEIVVTDTGAGIDAALLPVIFDRFRQGDSSSTRKHGGLGLGLALVKHIAELHGGTVRAESAGEGQGATFTVTLPLSLGPPPSLAAVHREAVAPVAVAAVALDGLRVLFVDDDPDTLELFAGIVAATGAHVRTATSVAEALTIIPSWHPDVLVADIEMPDEDGYALIAQVRKLTPEQGGAVPAVAVTAYGRVEDRVRLVTAGYDIHLPKPVEPAELLAVLASLARRAGGGTP